MDREVAIKALSLMEHIESIAAVYEPVERSEDTTVRELKEACRMATEALRAQQAHTRLDRSRWEECPDCKGEVFAKRRQYMRPVMEPLTPEQALMDKLTELTGIVYVKVKNEFCPFCGRPLTEEAWAEMERRITGG